MVNASRWTDRDGPRGVRARLEAVLWQTMNIRRKKTPPFPKGATGRPGRLLGEREGEKAARGVDGRSFPWGDHLDPSWACLRESRAGRLLPAVVDGWPVDTSVYGVRGLGGNVADWCADVFRREGPQVEGARLPSSYPWAPDAQLGRVTRGGDWVSAMRAARSAYRGAHLPSSRFGALGFRVAYAPAP